MLLLWMSSGSNRRSQRRTLRGGRWMRCVGGKKMGALDASNTGGVEKFKRPKRASRKRQLSAAALAEHNKLLGDRVREETPFVLSYTPKSLIQALLLRPKLRRLGLSATKYTQVNKAVSRHLYGLVSGRVEYVVWLNKVAELVEREGVEKRQYAEFVQHGCPTS
ncbi:hypothetical protein KL925_005236 [Ogataea polymorpha]|nr:hypothetical protein KL925_005236 [Ogataea polymorpha]